MGFRSGFIKEFSSSLLMFFMFYPVCTYLAQSSMAPYPEWIVHFMLVVLIDIITNGGCMNPSVVVGCWVNQMIPLGEAFGMFLGQHVGGILSFILLRDYFMKSVGKSIFGPLDLVGPSITNAVGSEKHIKFHNCIMTEAALSFAFMIVVFLVTKYVKNPNIYRPIYAVALRILINIGASLGGVSMNPMIGLGWVYYIKEELSHTQRWENIVAFCIAPIMGTCSAALLWAFFNNSEANEANEHTEADGEVVEVEKKRKRKTN